MDLAVIEARAVLAVSLPLLAGIIPGGLIATELYETMTICKANVIGTLVGVPVGLLVGYIIWFRTRLVPLE